MLSRTQPRPKDAPNLSLAQIQDPMIDAYMEALPKGVEPRILASRTVFAADDRKDVMRFAEIGLARFQARAAETGRLGGNETTAELIVSMDAHIGTPDEVIASLAKDGTLERATDLTVQVHSIDPPHPFILRSIELVADVVGPALGFGEKRRAAA